MRLELLLPAGIFCAFLVAVTRDAISDYKFYAKNNWDFSLDNKNRITEQFVGDSTLKAQIESEFCMDILSPLQ